jgi:hypothetical protein
MEDGYSNDELLAIGTRKIKLNLAMSATDINRDMSFEQSKILEKQFVGLSDNELKEVGERRMQFSTVLPKEIRDAEIRTQSNFIENAFDHVQKMLGIQIR